MSRKLALGLDFGTGSARAILVSVADGQEVATAVEAFANGVIDTTLPGTGEKLPRDWALQHPRDYLHALETTVRKAMEQAGAKAEDVVGIGVDFTACTLIPVDATGTPLCMLEDFAANKHAWPKLWKDHGALEQAARITALAQERGETWLAQYGGAVSSEWLFPKALKVLEEAPEVYAAAARFIEAGDWLVLQLTGEEKRNACAAGYKGLYTTQYPSRDFLAALNPAFADIVQEKLHPEVHPVGVRAGGLTAEMAARLGLAEGTPVSTAVIDAHAGVPGCAVADAGKLVIIMGTSFCHLVCGTGQHVIPGLAGVVKDGILPGFYGYEAGQAAGGDLYAWVVEQCVPHYAHEAAAAEGISVHAWLSREAEKLAPGESGLVCLDWWNGNRSILADAELTGMMLGMTLSTTPAEIYRAALESTAFGTLKIITQMEEGGLPIESIYACGGLPNSNPLCMQIFADVTGREIKIAASEQTVALGSAMFGACAAGRAGGGHDTIADAARAMAKVKDVSYRPDAARHDTYQKLFAQYERLHDYFGRDPNSPMKALRKIRDEI
jgi:L-ribulokinase